jgi:hypothetical protein
VVTISRGKITVEEKGKKTNVDLEWIIGNMKTAIRSVSNRHSAYADLTKRWIRGLENSGVRIIPQVRREMEIYFGARENGAKQCFKTWHYWLGIINMATPIKRAVVKPDLYAQNFEHAMRKD